MSYVIGAFPLHGTVGYTVSSPLVTVSSELKSRTTDNLLEALQNVHRFLVIKQLEPVWCWSRDLQCLIVSYLSFDMEDMLAVPEVVMTPRKTDNDFD